MDPKKERVFVEKQELLKLRREDISFQWTLIPPNFPESRDRHHRPRAVWPGELYDQFGEHRRGPSNG